MSFDEEVSRSELFELVQYFSKNPFRARDSNSKVMYKFLVGGPRIVCLNSFKNC